jgi:hypothetical protein
VSKSKNLDEKLESLIDKWISLGNSVGVSESTIRSTVQKQASSMMPDVMRMHGGLNFDEEIGTLWSEKLQAKSEFGKKALLYLEINYPILASHGVRKEDVIAYWNLSAEDKTMQWLELNVFRSILFVLYLQQDMGASSLEEAAKIAGKMVQRFSPEFALVHVIQNDSRGNDSALPNELYQSLMPDLVALFEVGGLSALENRVGSGSSMNAVLRDSL